MQLPVMVTVAISIHALREEGDQDVFGVCKHVRVISIHALREEGDGLHFLVVGVDRGISIHALREEGDSLPSWQDRWSQAFLSTPSARRATGVLVVGLAATDISIHALREEGDWQASAPCGRHHGISIHALREEGDRKQRSHELQQRNFYPRPPRGGRQIV